MSAATFFQETFLGLIIHSVSKGKLLPYAEEKKDFEVPEHYQKGYKAAHSSERGTRVPSGIRTPGQASKPDSEASARTAVSSLSDDDAPQGPKAGKKAEKESSKPEQNSNSEEDDADGPPTDMDDDSDPYLVDWHSESDPDNPMNWSFRKKASVTGLICLLTTSVYMGSAIYSPGIPLLAEYFGVGTVTATLGLTLFVFGYGVSCESASSLHRA